MILIEALRLYCKRHKITVRKLKQETGLSHGTAANFLHGELLNADNFARILTWALRPALSDIKRSRNTEESGTESASIPPISRV